MRQSGVLRGLGYGEGDSDFAEQGRLATYSQNYSTAFTILRKGSRSTGLLSRLLANTPGIVLVRQ